MVFELLTPSSNRLLSAYVSEKTRTELLNGTASGGLGFYAMVQVSRRAEYADVTPEAFAQVSKGIESSTGPVNARQAGETVDEINMRLKVLGAKPVAVDRPEIIGALFRKPDALGWAMLMGVQSGDRNVTMAGAIATIRTRQRLLFAYLYHPYESPKTLDLLRSTLEVWADEIIAANK